MIHIHSLKKNLFPSFWKCYGTQWARATKNVKKPQSQMGESCRKAWFKIFVKQNRIFLVSDTHLILRFFIVQNKFQQTNKNKINRINDNYIKFEVSLHFGGIWPTVWQAFKNMKAIIHDEGVSSIASRHRSWG